MKHTEHDALISVVGERSNGMIRLVVPTNVKITYVPDACDEKPSLLRGMFRALNAWLRVS